jgi:hypothetical protein
MRITSINGCNNPPVKQRKRKPSERRDQMTYCKKCHWGIPPRGSGSHPTVESCSRCDGSQKFIHYTCPNCTIRISEKAEQPWTDKGELWQCVVCNNSAKPEHWGISPEPQVVQNIGHMTPDQFDKYLYQLIYVAGAVDKPIMKEITVVCEAYRNLYQSAKAQPAVAQ